MQKLPKTTLTHETVRQTDAGGATIASYIMHTTPAISSIKKAGYKVESGRHLYINVSGVACVLPAIS